MSKPRWMYYTFWYVLLSPTGSFTKVPPWGAESGSYSQPWLICWLCAFVYPNHMSQMVVILCHWLCNALCAKSSVNSNSSMHNHVGILKGEREVSSDVCCRDKPRMSPSPSFRALILCALVKQVLANQTRSARSQVWWVNTTSHSHSLAIKLPYPDTKSDPCYLATSASIWCTERVPFISMLKKWK